jgi:ABC-2 type transport system ATP-binding protein
MISVHGVCKSYGKKQALHDVSFEIAKGEICGYIGPNGAGKSTTVKIMTGMLRPDAGEVRLAGIDVLRQPDKVKSLIGYVPETGAVFESLTAREYLLFAGRLFDIPDDIILRRGDALLQYFGLSAVADNMMTTYSKGMRQKVIISTSILHSPDIYFFDEPLDGLDAHATVLFKELIHHLALRGKTILYCSHLLDIVERVCHRMIILRGGSIVAQGNIAELRALTRQETLEDAFTILTESDNVSDKTIQLLDALETLHVPE